MWIYLIKNLSRTKLLIRYCLLNVHKFWIDIQYKFYGCYDMACGEDFGKYRLTYFFIMWRHWVKFGIKIGKTIEKAKSEKICRSACSSKKIGSLNISRIFFNLGSAFVLILVIGLQTQVESKDAQTGTLLGAHGRLIQHNPCIRCFCVRLS